MKKKKLKAKLVRTKKKLSAAQSQLVEVLAIMDKSGMPKAGSEPAVGATPVPKPTQTSKRRPADSTKPTAAKPKPATKRS